jgi:hypothetical protein
MKNIKIKKYFIFIGMVFETPLFENTFLKTKITFHFSLSITTIIHFQWALYIQAIVWGTTH